jgi:hypothetical protein
MATNLEIANSALIKLGQEKITAYPDTSTKRGKTVSEQLPKMLAKILREGNWNFATKRIKLSVEPFTITSANISVSTDLFTQTAHGYITGLKVHLTTDGALFVPFTINTDYYVIKISVNTFKLALSLADALAGTAINITGSGNGNTIVTPQDITPEFQYDYSYTLPRDYARMQKVNSDVDGSHNVDYKVESGKLLSNDLPLYVVYTANITDPSMFPSDFSEMFSTLLAADTAYDLVQSKELAKALMTEYQEALAFSRFNDGFEQRNEDLQVDYYLNERF